MSLSFQVCSLNIFLCVSWSFIKRQSLHTDTIDCIVTTRPTAVAPICTGNVNLLKTTSGRMQIDSLTDAATLNLIHEEAIEERRCLY